MNIAQHVSLLVEVALLERQIQEKEQLRKQLPAKADTARSLAASFHEKAEQLRLSLIELVQNRKKLEDELNVERGNIRKWEKRAHEIQGERAYSGLMSEIQSKKKFISDTEDKVLQLMQNIETAEKEHELAKKNAQSSQENAEKEWSSVSAEIEHIDELLLTLRKSLGDFLNQLSPLEKSRYERVSSKRMGIGIAFLEKQVCQSCRHTVPPELFLRVAKGEIIEQCPSCQRILVVRPVAENPVIHS